MKKGFTETAFMSSTASLEVALDYSGVKAGKVGVVFITSASTSLSLRCLSPTVA
jgi:hypothetical protein